MGDPLAGPEEAAPRREPHIPVISLADLPGVPDFLGTAARVDSVATLIQRAQEQHQHLHHIMVLNGQSPSDHVAMDGQGEAIAPTYQERFESLTKGILELIEQNQDIADELTAEAVKRRKAIERRLENAD